MRQQLVCRQIARLAAVEDCLGDVRSEIAAAMTRCRPNSSARVRRNNSFKFHIRMIGAGGLWSYRERVLAVAADGIVQLVDRLGVLPVFGVESGFAVGVVEEDYCPDRDIRAAALWAFWIRQTTLSSRIS